MPASFTGSSGIRILVVRPDAVRSVYEMNTGASISSRLALLASTVALTAAMPPG